MAFFILHTFSLLPIIIIEKTTIISGTANQAIKYISNIQGGLSFVQSRQTGNFYATVKQCSIPSTFDEATARQMIGERIPGSVVKKQCEPYDFVSKTTGEIVF